MAVDVAGFGGTNWARIEAARRGYDTNLLSRFWIGASQHLSVYSPCVGHFQTNILLRRVEYGMDWMLCELSGWEPRQYHLPDHY